MFARQSIKFIFILMLFILMGNTNVSAKENFTGIPISEFQGVAWRANGEDIERWALEKGTKFVQSIQKYEGTLTTLVYNGRYADEAAEYRFYLYKGQLYQVL